MEVHEVEKIISERVREEVGKLVRPSARTQQEKQKKLFQIAERFLYSYPALKRSLERHEKLAPGNMPEGYMKNIEEARIIIGLVESALDFIPEPEHRKAVEMHYFKNSSYEVIARELHCSERTISRWTAKAIERMKPVLFGIMAVDLEGIW